MSAAVSRRTAVAAAAVVTFRFPRRRAAHAAVRVFAPCMARRGMRRCRGLAAARAVRQRRAMRTRSPRGGALREAMRIGQHDRCPVAVRCVCGRGRSRRRRLVRFAVRAAVAGGVVAGCLVAGRLVAGIRQELCQPAAMPCATRPCGRPALAGRPGGRGANRRSFPGGNAGRWCGTRAWRGGGAVGVWWSRAGPVIPAAVLAAMDEAGHPAPTWSGARAGRAHPFVRERRARALPPRSSIWRGSSAPVSCFPFETLPLGAAPSRAGRAAPWPSIRGMATTRKAAPRAAIAADAAPAAFVLPRGNVGARSPRAAIVAPAGPPCAAHSV